MSTEAGSPDEIGHSVFRLWFSIVVLGVAACTMVTTEFAPIGLLSQISGNLGESQATIGLTVTLYAWFGAISGLLAPTLIGRIPRKTLLIGLMMVIVASNAGALLSHSLETFLLTRFAGSIAHGLFWAMVAAFAADIAPPGRMGLATSIVFGGISIATVMGVPIVNLVGQAMGWRMAFGLIALVGLLAALSMMVVLPKLETGSQDHKATLVDVAYSRGLWPIYAITAFTAGAHFAAYTFAEPFIGAIPDILPTTVPILLFSFGVAGLLGSVLGGILIDRFMRAVIVCALSTMAIALVVMGWKGPDLGLMSVAACMMSWGIAISMLFASLQTWILRASGPLATPAAAVHTAVLNAAIGFGAVIGALLLKLSGLSAVMLGAGLIAILPLVLISRVSRMSYGRASR